jgi:hypothetical protein
MRLETENHMYPTLEQPTFDETLRSLHLASRLLSVVSLLQRDHQPMYFELALQPTPRGLRTGNLPDGIEATVDFARAAIVLQHNGAEVATVDLADRSQGEALRALLPEVQRHLPTALPAPTVEAAFEAIQARQGEIVLSREELTDSAPLHIDGAVAADYARVLYTLFTGLARFRARIAGAMMPVVVWPHGFDLSMLWFAGPAMDDHKTPHLNFGFSPRSGGLPRPYLYVTAWPLPENYAPPALPDGARWHTEGWRGVVASYDGLRSAENLEERVESVYEEVYGVLRAALPQHA